MLTQSTFYPLSESNLNSNNKNFYSLLTTLEGRYLEYNKSFENNFKMGFNNLYNRFILEHVYEHDLQVCKKKLQINNLDFDKPVEVSFSKLCNKGHLVFLNFLVSINFSEVHNSLVLTWVQQ